MNDRAKLYAFYEAFDMDHLDQFVLDLSGNFTLMDHWLDLLQQAISGRIWNSYKHEEFFFSRT
jgi:hypothetical protein